MKDYAVSLTKEKEGADQKRNILREYIQSYVLSLLQKEGVFQAWAFVGGTALRFLHDLPRFSEDLDFSLEKKYDKTFEDILRSLRGELRASGYSIDVTFNDQKNVQSSMLKFQDILYEAGISPLKDQKLSIKLEIDTKPPAGADSETKIVNTYMPISFLSYDISSLFAGKLHAMLSRPYIKARDFYDLCWYLSKFKDLTPNIGFLQNALKQTGWEKELPTKENWKRYIAEVCRHADWDAITRDVMPFLERSGDMDVFTKETALSLLQD
ncbi:MAG: nucleotidyl transferase AbiEii/AbiGii toxin family protein [Candidatus Omnitrophota bacterium]